LDLLEDVKKYLPQFLSRTSSEELFSCLKDFPDNIDSRMYCDYLKEESFFAQGDGVAKLKMVSWKTQTLVDVNAIILSNTCDISKENKRTLPPSCTYCLVLELDKYLDLLRRERKDEGYIKNFENDIKRQSITSIFYLPKAHDLDKEYIALMDHVGSCPISHLDNTKTKLFSLSNYGFYMFLLKLSIHFTRVKDGIDRSDVNVLSVN